MSKMLHLINLLCDLWTNFEPGVASMRSLPANVIAIFIPELVEGEKKMCGFIKIEQPVTQVVWQCSWLQQVHFLEKVISLRGNINWPPWSPDLTAPDFFLWSNLRYHVYRNRPHNLEELKSAQKLKTTHETLWAVERLEQLVAYVIEVVTLRAYFKN